MMGNWKAPMITMEKLRIYEKYKKDIEEKITMEKLRIYEKFNGDIDGFSRSAKPSERESIQDGDWRLIDELLQSLTIVRSGSGNAEFEARVRERVINAAQDESVCERLLRLSKQKT